MSQPAILFNDGAAYEKAMGVWSRVAGEDFLAWLAPASGLRWVDVGCGNGAFTELLMQRHAPAEVQGIDPSEGQLAFARTRPGAAGAVFGPGDAQALPFAEDRFDAATMALVLFFVPDPAKGIAEMRRVVRPGGAVAAYVWDMAGGGFPFHPMQQVLRAMGHVPALPPSAGISRMDALREAWTQGGLRDVETRRIEVRRRYPSFDELWATTSRTGSITTALAQMTEPQVDELKDRLRAALPAAPDGSITYGAVANAVKGVV